ncbi:MAG: sirohydrochlorin cobaltochelatase, partial [Pseudomonadota bacterium]
ASIEGIPDHEAVLAKMKRQELVKKYGRVRIIPMMFFAGMHAEEDLMGASKSWRSVLAGVGFTVDCLKIRFGNKELFKGLAYYPEILTFFMDRLRRTLTLADYY